MLSHAESSEASPALSGDASAKSVECLIFRGSLLERSQIPDHFTEAKNLQIKILRFALAEESQDLFLRVLFLCFFCIFLWDEVIVLIYFCLFSDVQESI